MFARETERGRSERAQQMSTGASEAKVSSGGVTRGGNKETLVYGAFVGPGPHVSSEEELGSQRRGQGMSTPGLLMDGFSSKTGGWGPGDGEARGSGFILECASGFLVCGWICLSSNTQQVHANCAGSYIKKAVSLPLLPPGRRSTPSITSCLPATPLLQAWSLFIPSPLSPPS